MRVRGALESNRKSIPRRKRVSGRPILTRERTRRLMKTEFEGEDWESIALEGVWQNLGILFSRAVGQLGREAAMKIVHALAAGEASPTVDRYAAEERLHDHESSRGSDLSLLRDADCGAAVRVRRDRRRSALKLLPRRNSEQTASR